MLANLTLALVLAHIAAVFLASFAHRENLIRAMITVYKSSQSMNKLDRAYDLVDIDDLVQLDLFGTHARRRQSEVALDGLAERFGTDVCIAPMISTSQRLLSGL